MMTSWFLAEMGIFIRCGVMLPYKLRTHPTRDSPPRIHLSNSVLRLHATRPFQQSRRKTLIQATECLQAEPLHIPP